MVKHKKRGRRSRMKRYLKGKIEQDCDLGALATKALVSCVSSEVARERLLLSSVSLSWTLKDMTIIADDGPILCGLAHSDYTAAEIEEVIENSGSWDEGDLVQQEVAKRKVRIIGIFRSSNLTAAGAAVLNNGEPIKTKLNWILTTGKGLDFFFYNMGSDAITTGAQGHVYGHANLFPQ